jgi:hypothetical protein
MTKKIRKYVKCHHQQQQDGQLKNFFFTDKCYNITQVNRQKGADDHDDDHDDVVCNS